MNGQEFCVLVDIAPGLITNHSDYYTVVYTMVYTIVYISVYNYCSIAILTFCRLNTGMVTITDSVYNLWY